MTILISSLISDPIGDIALGSGGARDSMLPGHSQVNYSANQVKRKPRNTMPPCRTGRGI